jgi:hypothetical protein
MKILLTFFDSLKSGEVPDRSLEAVVRYSWAESFFVPVYV